jgi:hypothetical protein
MRESGTAVFSPLRMTGDSPTPGLTPALALGWLRELSAGMGAAVVLDAAGAPLAGDASLAAPARRLLASAAPDAPVARERSSGGAWLLVARGTGDLAVAARAAPEALMPLLEHDLRVALSALGSARMP